MIARTLFFICVIVLCMGWSRAEIRYFITTEKLSPADDLFKEYKLDEKKQSYKVNIGYKTESQTDENNPTILKTFVLPNAEISPWDHTKYYCFILKMYHPKHDDLPQGVDANRSGEMKCFNPNPKAEEDSTGQLIMDWKSPILTVEDAGPLNCKFYQRHMHSQQEEEDRPDYMYANDLLVPLEGINRDAYLDDYKDQTEKLKGIKKIFGLSMIYGIPDSAKKYFRFSESDVNKDYEPEVIALSPEERQQQREYQQKRAERAREDLRRQQESQNFHHKMEMARRHDAVQRSKRNYRHLRGSKSPVSSTERPRQFQKLNV